MMITVHRENAVKNLHLKQRRRSISTQNSFDIVAVFRPVETQFGARGNYAHSRGPCRLLLRNRIGGPFGHCGARGGLPPYTPLSTALAVFWQQSRTLLRHCCWCGRGLMSTWRADAGREHNTRTTETGTSELLQHAVDDSQSKSNQPRQLS